MYAHEKLKMKTDAPGATDTNGLKLESAIGHLSDEWKTDHEKKVFKFYNLIDEQPSGVFEKT
jgi:hypothetical protein